MSLWSSLYPLSPTHELHHLSIVSSAPCQVPTLCQKKSYSCIQGSKASTHIILDLITVYLSLCLQTTCVRSPRPPLPRWLHVFRCSRVPAALPVSSRLTRCLCVRLPVRASHQSMREWCPSCLQVFSFIFLPKCNNWIDLWVADIIQLPAQGRVSEFYMDKTPLVINTTEESRGPKNSVLILIMELWSLMREI